MPSNVIRDVLTERARQDSKWGGPTHDDAHGLYDWSYEITTRADDLAAIAVFLEPVADFQQKNVRKILVEIAALAVAAIESHDRKNP